MLSIEPPPIFYLYPTPLILYPVQPTPVMLLLLSSSATPPPSGGEIKSLGKLGEYKPLSTKYYYSTSSGIIHTFLPFLLLDSQNSEVSDPARINPEAFSF